MCREKRMKVGLVGKGYSGQVGSLGRCRLAVLRQTTAGFKEKERPAVMGEGKSRRIWFGKVVGM